MDFRLVDKSTVSSDLLRFAKHCEDLAGNSEMPHRDRFEPCNLTWLLNHLTAIDVLDDGRDYRFCHADGLWKILANFDYLGVRLSEVEDSGALKYVRSNFDAAVRDRTPRYRFGRWTWPNQKFIRVERLLVPFVDEHGKVSMLVLAEHCDTSIPDIHEACRAFGTPRLELEFSQQT